MITKDELFGKLDALGIEYSTRSHPALFTVADSQKLHGEMPGGHSKNLFLKDKKGALFLVVAEQSSQVNLKTLHKHIGAQRLSFGKPELLMEVLGMIPGSVNPFSLMNDTDKRCTLWLDKALISHELVNFHPLENTSTTTLKSADLLRFLESIGFAANQIDFTVLD
ncbi:MAG: prolyl-tRNA synthetase associated domain-containing protein [Hyphomicrobiales bacterium]